MCDFLFFLEETLFPSFLWCLCFVPVVSLFPHHFSTLLILAPLVLLSHWTALSNVWPLYWIQWIPLPPSTVALPLPHHLRSAWHAVIWREVQLWWDADQEKHLWFLPSGPANLLSGNKPFNSENIMFCFLLFFFNCLHFQNCALFFKTLHKSIIATTNANASHLLQN